MGFAMREVAKSRRSVISQEHFDNTFDINVKGLLFTVQKALPLVVDGGLVILNASTTASTGIRAQRLQRVESGGAGAADICRT